MTTVEDILIEPEDIPELIRKRRIKVGDKIRSSVLRGPSIVSHVDINFAISIDPIYPQNDTQLPPTEIHKRFHNSYIEPFYAEVHGPSSTEYDKLLKQFQELQLRGGI